MEAALVPGVLLGFNRNVSNPSPSQGALSVSQKLISEDKKEHLRQVKIDNLGYSHSPVVGTYFISR